MIKQRLESFLYKRCTLPGVSLTRMNCVNAAIKMANEHIAPITLIASRRRVDSEICGCRYVNNWNTENSRND
jgi:hypothetical protein